MATNNALNNASSPFTVSSGNLVVTTGNMSTSAGSITAATTLTASSGDVTVTSGNLLLPMTTSTIGQIKIAGRRYFHIYGTNGDTGNLFVGSNAGNFTASGAGLAFNYGFGGLVFAALTTGQYNVGMGYGSLGAMTTGSQNTCVGGVSILDALTTGSYNTGIGAGTLHSLITGAGNIAIGLYGVSLGSGRIYTSSESWNICIGAGGTIGESNVLRIGTQEAAGVGVNKAYIAGIYNTAVGATAGVVLSDSAHQLGGLAGAAGTVLVGGTKPSFSTTVSATAFNTNVAAAQLNMSGTTMSATGSDTDISITITPKGAGTIVSLPVYSKQVTSNVRTLLVDDAGLFGNATSSRKFKDNIQNMSDNSSPLMSLRPVTFTYKGDTSNSKRFGLIAEEVAEVMPSLVSFDSAGEPYTVSYHDMPAILLNELQKMNKRVIDLEARLVTLEKQ